MTKTKLPSTERVVSYTNPSTGYWVIPSEKQIWHLAGTLNPSMTQDELAKYSSQEGFHALSVPDHFELFQAMYDLRNNGGEIEKARRFVKGSMRNNFLNTLTRLQYASKGKDKIIHNYKTSSERKLKTGLVGADGLVKDVLSLEVSLALTGKKPEEIEEILSYINKTPAYIWRVNSKPSETDERVAWFDAGSDGAGLYCVRYPSYRDGSLGVREARIQ